MNLKAGVKVQGLRPETLLGVMVASNTYHNHDSELIITSGVDGKHSHTSLHYAGCAFDCRIRHLPEGKAKEIADEIRSRLTEDYDVILETTHIHIEYQPRRLCP